MAKLEIVLHTKKGDVTYGEHHISGQKYLDLLTMQSLFSKDTSMEVSEVIQKRLEFTASLFSDPQVTADSILEGTDPWDLMPMLDRIQRVVVGSEETDEKKEQ